jgi:hypothetical protein
MRRVRNRRRLRKRCDARVKNLIKTRKNGVAILRSPFCCAWAMPNGRCRVHGGASTGPKSPEGKAPVVAAMVEGRRRWAERVRAAGRQFTAGRKSGKAWLTEAMRERAREEARRLKLGAWYEPDRALTLALLRSASGDSEGTEKAKALILAAMREEMRAAKDERDVGRAAVIFDDYFRSGLIREAFGKRGVRAG